MKGEPALACWFSWKEEVRTTQPPPHLLHLHINPADIIYNFWTSYGAVKGLMVPFDGDVVLEALHWHLKHLTTYLYMHTNTHADKHNNFNVVIQG